MIAGGLAGARSYAAIASWAAELPERVFDWLGLTRRAPKVSTIRRVVLAVDADVLDGVLCAWVATRCGAQESKVIAVDGKSVRGARRPDGRAVHLMAALDQNRGAVLAQLPVDAKSNEITAFAPLLDQIPLAGAVVSADAMHTQVAHARYLRRRGAHYVLTVKANQPGLLAQVAALPWAAVPVALTSTETGHGRIERRQVKVTSVARGIPFPNAALAVQVVRDRKQRGKPATTETVYAVTDLTWEQTTPEQLAQVIRGHWRIEDGLHWVRDVTLGEDASQIRTGASAQVMATVRNIAVSLHRLAGATNIAAATRAIFRRPERLLPLIR